MWASITNAFITKWRHLNALTRGMTTYAIVWPTANLIQQSLDGKNLRTYDWMQTLRFGIYGSLYVAPTLHGWVRLSSAMWPQTNFRTGLTKAIVEQFSYTPFALASFFMGISLLELKTFGEAVEETRNKLLPTYKIGLCFWPILQTINFSVIPERNRVVFVSICSLIWTTFLAYMKTHNTIGEEEDKRREKDAK